VWWLKDEEEYEEACDENNRANRNEKVLMLAKSPTL
jgi:hypothetical protein